MTVPGLTPGPDGVYTFKQLAEHVRQLARAFHVGLMEVEGLAPESGGAGEFTQGLRKRKGVRIAPVRDYCTYAVALHELGHCVSPTGMMPECEINPFARMMGMLSARQVRLQLEEERAAWEWARHHALVWTVEMSAVRKQGYNSYRAFAHRMGITDV